MDRNVLREYLSPALTMDRNVMRECLSPAQYLKVLVARQRRVTAGGR